VIKMVILQRILIVMLLQIWNFELSAVIAEDEVVKAIKSLKNNKSCGTDMILNKFLKIYCQKMIDVYVKLFNIVFKSGVIPDLWSVGVICPI
jgi:hypothetical protein